MKAYIEEKGERVEIEIGAETEALAGMQKMLREGGAQDILDGINSIAAHQVETRKFIFVQLKDVVFEDEKEFVMIPERDIY